MKTLLRHQLFMLNTLHYMPFYTRLFVKSISLVSKQDVNLSINSNGSSAFCTGVGTQLVKASGTHMLIVLLDVLLAVQVFSAVEAVEALRHDGAEIASWT